MNFQDSLINKTPFIELLKKIKPNIVYKYYDDNLVYGIDYVSSTDERLGGSLIAVQVEYEKISGTNKVRVGGNVLTTCLNQEFMELYKLIGFEGREIIFVSESDRFY